jgi:hypothetical protein
MIGFYESRVHSASLLSRPSLKELLARQKEIDDEQKISYRAELAEAYQL